jgi:hypothetical protein
MATDYSKVDWDKYYKLLKEDNYQGARALLPPLSECSCRGLQTFSELSDYYRNRAVEDPKSPRAKKYEDAKRLSNKLYSILTNKGVRLEDDTTPPVSSISNDKGLKISLDSCNEGDGPDCVHTLEMILGRVHPSAEAQKKLICDRHDILLSYDNVDAFLTDIFKGFWKGTRHGELEEEIKRDPFDYHFSDIYPQCERYKKK